MVFLYFVLYINVCSKSHEWEVLVHGSLYKKVTVFEHPIASQLSPGKDDEGLSLRCGSHTPL